MTLNYSWQPAVRSPLFSVLSSVRLDRCADRGCCCASQSFPSSWTITASCGTQSQSMPANAYPTGDSSWRALPTGQTTTTTGLSRPFCISLDLVKIVDCDVPSLPIIAPLSMRLLRRLFMALPPFLLDKSPLSPPLLFTALHIATFLLRNPPNPVPIPPFCSSSCPLVIHPL